MRILLADDHARYRQAVAAQIKLLFPLADVDEAASFEAASDIADAADTAYDLFLVDFHMPGVSFAAIARLVRALPKTPLAVMSMRANYDDVRGVIEAGARGFLPKIVTSAQFASTLGLLLGGGTSMPADIFDSNREPADHERPIWLAELSPREREVLKAVARGISNKEIGRELNLAEVTIKLHLRAIFRKTGAHSRAEAAVLATRAGIA